MMNDSNDWFIEPIEDVKGSSKLYKFICFVMGKRKKKLTYQEMYLLLYGLNRRKLGNLKAKEIAMSRILGIYKELHNNNLPEGIEE